MKFFAQILLLVSLSLLHSTGEAAKETILEMLFLTKIANAVNSFLLLLLFERLLSAEYCVSVCIWLFCYAPLIVRLGVAMELWVSRL